LAHYFFYRGGPSDPNEVVICAGAQSEYVVPVSVAETGMRFAMSSGDIRLS